MSIRLTGLLLATTIAFGAARVVICELACAEPGAAHAAGACHETDETTDTIGPLDSDHCISLQSTPALTTLKITAAQPRPIVLAVHSSTASQSQSVAFTSTTSSEFDLGARAASRLHRTTVLRI